MVRSLAVQIFRVNTVSQNRQIDRHEQQGMVASSSPAQISSLTVNGYSSVKGEDWTGPCLSYAVAHDKVGSNSHHHNAIGHLLHTFYLTKTESNPNS